MIKIREIIDNTIPGNIKLEISKKQKIGRKNYSTTIIFYKNQLEEIHFSFIHPQEIARFEVQEEDGLFYQSVHNLYQNLAYIEEIHPQKRRKNGFYVVTDDNMTGTANGLLLEKQENGYCFQFDEYYTFQPGFTEIVISKNNPTNRVNYVCFEHTFEDLKKQINSSSQTKKILQKKKVPITLQSKDLSL